MGMVLSSRNSLLVLVGAAVAYAVGTACAAFSWATASETGPWHYLGLYQAEAWLHAAGFVAVSAAVVLAGWGAVRFAESAGEDRAEIVGAALAGLVVTGGYCRIAATTPYDSSGHLIVAIGLALWAPLALLQAAHQHAASRRGDHDSPRLGALWSAASLGLLLNAIGTDLVPVGPDADKGIANGVLGAVGAALVAYALISARSRGWLSLRSTGFAAVGVAALAVSSIGYAIVSHVELGASGTLTGFKVGYALVFGGSAVAVLVLGLSAAVQRHQATADHMTSAQP